MCQYAQLVTLRYLFNMIWRVSHSAVVNATTGAEKRKAMRHALSLIDALEEATLGADEIVKLLSLKTAK